LDLRFWISDSKPAEKREVIRLLSTRAATGVVAEGTRPEGHSAAEPPKKIKRQRAKVKSGTLKFLPLKNKKLRPGNALPDFDKARGSVW
jgi:hypothetical protein